MLSEQDSIKILHEKIVDFPEMCIVLGSGWDEVLKEVLIESEISYVDLFGIKTLVKGHAGKLVIGSFQGKRVAFMAGRFHMYEGFSAREATMPVRVFGALGLKQLVLTSASGALNEKYQVGDMIVLSDLITLFLSPDSPLVGPEFVDMSQVFDEYLRQIALHCCYKNTIAVHEGVYAYAHGPHYETPADKMMLRFLGADVVGMSTVPETIMARSLGISVLGLSIVTNLAFVKHSHEEVVGAARQGSIGMTKIIKEIVKYTDYD